MTEDAEVTLVLSLTEDQDCLKQFMHMPIATQLRLEHPHTKPANTHLGILKLHRIAVILFLNESLA